MYMCTCKHTVHVHAALRWGICQVTGASTSTCVFVYAYHYRVHAHVHAHKSTWNIHHLYNNYTCTQSNITTETNKHTYTCLPHLPHVASTLLQRTGASWHLLSHSQSILASFYGARPIITHNNDGYLTVSGHHKRK